MPSTLTDTPAPQWGEVAGWQLPLAQLCDSALPTGAFSHSFGLETYICEGVVDGEASFVSWLRALVFTQLTFSEGLGLRLAFEAVMTGRRSRTSMRFSWLRRCRSKCAGPG